MADITHHFPIAAPIDQVFRAFSTPNDLDQWWSKESSGEPVEGAEYSLGFGSGCTWRARVTECVDNETFELTLTEAQEDWLGSRVRVDLSEQSGSTLVRFRHSGWPSENAHYYTSCYCWAMYLRILKRYVEHGETVPYEIRLDV
jgi:uncharacterized protein YndB with AHSA1/START domain